jgi:hypothetical protein
LKSSIARPTLLAVAASVCPGNLSIGVNVPDVNI